MVHYLSTCLLSLTDTIKIEGQFAKYNRTACLCVYMFCFMNVVCLHFYECVTTTKILVHRLHVFFHTFSWTGLLYVFSGWDGGCCNLQQNKHCICIQSENYVRFTLLLCQCVSHSSYSVYI